MPKYCPLYVQIDSEYEISLAFSLNVVHPRILFNTGMPTDEYIVPGYLFLEEFSWFEHNYLPKAKGFLQTNRYDGVEVKFQPGRHYCRCVLP